MYQFTEHEKRTMRIAFGGLAAFLVLFGGFRAWQFLETKRGDYDKLVQDSKTLKEHLEPYEAKTLIVQKLMDNFELDPAKLQRATLVADASSAIQKSAMGSGIQVGPVRESPSRASSKELASVQLEATGSVTAIMGLLGRMETLGFPLIVDSVQLTAEPSRPGQVKANLTVVILDFDQWKQTEVPHA